MNSLLVISNKKKQLETITEACRLWKKDCHIISANDENEAVTAATENRVDLAIRDLTDTAENDSEKLARFTYTVPYIPCIAIIDTEIHLPTKILKLGVSAVLESTFAPEDLHRWLTELYESSTTGEVKGIEVHNLLQTLEGTGATCTLKVATPIGQKGLIFINEGEVIAAETKTFNKEEAIYEIIGWNRLSVEIKYYNGMRKKEISSTVMPLIMNALHLKDERTKLEIRQITKNKPKLELQYYSTSARKINLQYGSRIKLEIDEINASLLSTMVGIVPDKFLIISKPKGFDKCMGGLEKKGSLIISYLNMGKMCMFTSHLLQEISEPAELLFMEFPKLIHYHELRKAERARTFIPSTLTSPAEIDYNCVLTDLSTNGGMCEIFATRNAPLPEIDPGTPVKLQCLLPGLESQQVIQGLIKNVRKGRLKVNLGIEFIEPNEDITDSIHNYLQSLERIKERSMS